MLFARAPPTRPIPVEVYYTGNRVEITLVHEEGSIWKTHRRLGPTCDKGTHHIAMIGLHHDTSARPDGASQRPENSDIFFRSSIPKRRENIAGNVKPCFGKRCTQIMLHIP